MDWGSQVKSFTLHIGWGWVESAQKVQHIKVSSSAKVDSAGTEGTVECRGKECLQYDNNNMYRRHRRHIIQYVQEAY